MKNIYILTLALLVCGVTFPLHAQNAVDRTSPVHKGSWLVSGSAGIEMAGGDNFEVDGEGRTTITLAPQALYFIMDQLGVGALLQFTSMSQGDYSSSTLTVGPQAVYYFTMEDSPLYPFIGAGVLFGSVSESQTVNNVEVESSSSSSVILLTGGLMYAFNPYVGLHGSLNYELHTYSRDVNDVSVSQNGNVFAVRFGFDIFLH